MVTIDKAIEIINKSSETFFNIIYYADHQDMSADNFKTLSNQSGILKDRLDKTGVSNLEKFMYFRELVGGFEHLGLALYHSEALSEDYNSYDIRSPLNEELLKMLTLHHTYFSNVLPNLIFSLYDDAGLEHVRFIQDGEVSFTLPAEEFELAEAEAKKESAVQQGRKIPEGLASSLELIINKGTKLIAEVKEVNDTTIPSKGKKLIEITNLLYTQEQDYANIVLPIAKQVDPKVHAFHDYTQVLYHLSKSAEQLVFFYLQHVMIDGQEGSQKNVREEIGRKIEPETLFFIVNEQVQQMKAYAKETEKFGLLLYNKITKPQKISVHFVLPGDIFEERNYSTVLSQISNSFEGVTEIQIGNQIYNTKNEEALQEIDFNSFLNQSVTYIGSRDYIRAMRFIHETDFGYQPRHRDSLLQEYGVNLEAILPHRKSFSQQSLKIPTNSSN